MASKKISDCRRIIAYLETHEWISPAIAAEEFHCYRFSGRIYDLKKAGHIFEEEMVYTFDADGYPTHYKRFKLIKKVA